MDSGQEATTRLTGWAAEAARLGPLAVRWFSPDGRGVTTVLDRNELFVGRADDVDVSLAASGVSRRHARLHRQGPIFALEDLESTNGCYVNGVRARHAGLSEGDVLRLGAMVGLLIRLPRERDLETIEEVAPGVIWGPGLAPELAVLERVAKSDLPIVIWGETGVGKERLAQTVHGASGRSGEFHGINCAAMPVALAEAELFGHRRGAFTGAEQAGLGHVRAANGGTLLLDEIADLALPVQAKLLRVLQEMQVLPLGETRAVPVDVRIVAACQAPLVQLVEEGRMRADLAARLNGLSVEVPPLRKRRIDVAVMFGYFLERLTNGLAPAVEAELLEALLLHEWPGNVRELELVTRQLLVMNPGEPFLRLRDLPSAFSVKPRARPSSSPPACDRRDHDARSFALELRRHGGKIAPAAAAANISRQRAYRLLAQRTVAEFLGEFADNDTHGSPARSSA